MAIPVVVDHDTEYEEALLQQLFADLWNTLQQIELIQRSRRNNQNLARVTATLPIPRRCREESGEQSEADRRNNPEFVNLAVSLSSGSIFQSTRRRRLRRSRGDSCEDTKPVKVSITVEIANKQRTQREKASESNGEDRGKSQSLFSKLVPAPISCSLWTAVICVVGWHLLRTR